MTDDRRNDDTQMLETGTEAATDAAPGTATIAAGPTRARLALGLGIAGIVVALAAAAVFVLGSPASPGALAYVPGDAAVVMEIRMDLPGDQMQKLGNLLAHFPGFADQSTLPAKIDEAFSKAVAAMSEGEVDYATEIKPWLNGPLFVAGSPDAMSESSRGGPERVLLVATTNGAVDCQVALADQAPTSQPYGGLELWVSSDGAEACATDDRFALAGDPDSVRSAIDTKAGGTGLDKEARYATARASLTGDQLASIYMSGAALAAGASPAADLPIPGLAAFAGKAPDWIMLGLRAEDDAVLIDAATAPIGAGSGTPSLLTMPPAHASELARLVPADTLLYLESQGTGVALQNLLTVLRTVPELDSAFQTLDGLASPEELVGWVEDVGLAISAEGTDPASLRPSAAVLLAASDAAAAAERVATVRTVLSLAAVSTDGLEVINETIAGVDVTTVSITDPGALLPPDAQLGDVPFESLAFSIGARDRIVYLTVGDGAMADVLAAQAGGSLADDPAYKRAAGHGLDPSGTTIYVAVGATVDFMQPFLPEEMAGTWATDVAPFVGPLDAFGVWTTSDDSGLRSRLVLTVSGP